MVLDPQYQCTANHLTSPLVSFSTRLRDTVCSIPHGRGRISFYFVAGDIFSVARPRSAKPCAGSVTLLRSRYVFLIKLQSNSSYAKARACVAPCLQQIGVLVRSFFGFTAGVSPSWDANNQDFGFSLAIIAYLILKTLENSLSSTLPIIRSIISSLSELAVDWPAAIPILVRPVLLT